MITKTDQNAERKVPWLGDLPIIGKVFRYDLFEYKRTELLIFLTPRIVRSDADMEMIKQVETGRMHFFQDDVESIHGPIFGVPRAGISPIEALPPVEIIRPKESVPTTPPVPPAPSLPAAPGRINPSSAKSLRQEGGSENVYRIGDLPVE
jgi:hypothetical protein